MIAAKIIKKLEKLKKNNIKSLFISLYIKLRKPSFKLVTFIANHTSTEKMHQWITDNSRNITSTEKDYYTKIINSFDLNYNQPPAIKLKIAVCISGEPRTFKYCINSFNRFFYGHDIDIYIACRSNTDIEAIKKHYAPTNINIYSDIDYSNLERKGIKAFGFINKKHGITIPQANPNILPMWYGIKQSLLALINSGNKPELYDAICRCRFDTFFKSPLPELNFKKDTIYIDPAYNEHDGYSDQFAIGHPSAMKEYFSLFNWIPQSYDLDYGEKGYLPERILKIYLEQHLALKVKGHPFETRLLRDDFIDLKSHELPVKCNTTNKDRNIRVQEYIKKHHPDLYPKN